MIRIRCFVIVRTLTINKLRKRPLEMDYRLRSRLSYGHQSHIHLRRTQTKDTTTTRAHRRVHFVKYIVYF